MLLLPRTRYPDFAARNGGREVCPRATSRTARTSSLGISRENSVFPSASLTHAPLLVTAKSKLRVFPASSRTAPSGLPVHTPKTPPCARNSSIAARSRGRKRWSGWMRLPIPKKSVPSKSLAIAFLACPNPAIENSFRMHDQVIILRPSSMPSHHIAQAPPLIPSDGAPYSRITRTWTVGGLRYPSASRCFQASSLRQSFPSRCQLLKSETSPTI